MLASAQRDLGSRFPQSGWVEQAPLDIWRTQLDAARDVLRQVGVENVSAVAVANQRETALVWDRETLDPIGPAIVWQCRRTADAAGALNRLHGAEVRARSGLRSDAYFSGPKFSWLLDNSSLSSLSSPADAARERAAAGDLACGTVDSWLLAKLTGGAVHATDVTNASRTMLWNLREQRWDEQLCVWQRVPMSMLPAVRPSGGEFGLTEPSLFGRALPILAVAGDQQAALYGHGIRSPGSAKCTYGTGAFVLSHAGSEADSESAPEGLLLTAAADGGFALEGGVFAAGSVVQWLRDELSLAASAAGISALAASTDSSDGVILIPALAGLGSPHWDSNARGAVLGLTRGATKAQIARAALEAVAFRVREIVDRMESGAGRIAELRVDGGMTQSGVLMQIQANVLQRPLIRPAMQETTALGVARLAMEVSGLESNFELEEQRFEPDGELEREFGRWSAAREAVQSLAP